MRHKRLGRRLGRSSSHRKALFKNLIRGLLLSERNADHYVGMFQSDGKTEVKPAQNPGRIVTTLAKAKEVRPILERCITMAKKAQPHIAAAEQFATQADRNTDAWKAWRKSDKWQQWVKAISPAVQLRRRVFSILRDKEAVRILFNDVAPRMADRNGGYTRILKLAKPRLGDAGVRAILELVGYHDRFAQSSVKPEFGGGDE